MPRAAQINNPFVIDQGQAGLGLRCQLGLGVNKVEVAQDRLILGNFLPVGGNQG